MINDVIDNINPFLRLDITTFYKVSEQLAKSNSHVNITDQQKYIIKIFHRKVIDLFKRKDYFISLENYNVFLKNNGDSFLDFGELTYWNKIYKTYKFGYFLKNINKNKHDNQNQDISTIIFTIEKFFKNYDGSFYYQKDLKETLKYIFFHINKKNNQTLYKKYKKLHNSLIKKKIDFDFYLLNQVISVEIIPIDNQLDTMELKFDNNQCINKNNKAVCFSNQHIQELSLDVNHYGFDGNLKLNLVIDSDEIHPNYQFLFYGQPLSLTIKIEQNYQFKIDHDNEDNFSETLIYHGISINNNVVNLNYNSRKRTIALSFSDPLKAFLSRSHPMRLSKDISYNDLFKRILLPYKEWIEIDNRAKDLLSKKNLQIFIFCDKKNNRSLYDFFIETLDFYQINLQCDYFSKLEEDNTINIKTKYILYSDPSILEEKIRKEKLPIESVEYNRWSMSHINIDISNNIKQSSAVLNIHPEVNKKIIPEANKQSKLDEPQPFKILDFYDETIICENKNRSDKYEKILKKNWEDEQKFSTNSQLTSNQILLLQTLYPSEQEYSKDVLLKHNIFQYTEQPKLSYYSIKLNITMNTDAWIRNHIVSIREIDENIDNKTEKYLEKLGLLKNTPQVTHEISTTYLFRTKLNLPNYTPFVDKKIQATIYTKKQVDPENQNEYKLVQANKKETSHTKRDETAPDTLTINSHTEHTPLIMLNLFNDILLDSKGSTDCIVYLSADQGQYFANQYYPLTQGMIVSINVINQEELTFDKVISNRLLPKQKGSEEFIQQTKYGLKDQATIGYTKNDQDEQMILEQTHNDNKGLKQILLSQNKGLSLKFSNKEN